MNTKQHNLKPVEHTFCVSGLLGRPDQRLTGRDYLGRRAWLVMGSPAGVFESHGLSAVIPGTAISA